MVAAHRKIEALGEGIRATLDLSDSPPVDLERVTVLLGARDLAAAAADAFRHVEMKPVLLARPRPDDALILLRSVDEQ
jgi:hypothetical protein